MESYDASAWTFQMTGGLSMKLIYFFEKIDYFCFIDSDLWIKVEAVENKS